MSILMMTYELLKEADVVQSAEEFSETWCQRSPSWYANRKHAEAEFSVATAINCNTVANLFLEAYQYRCDAGVAPTLIALKNVEEVRGLTQRYLERRYRIAELVMTPLSPLKELR